MSVKILVGHVLDGLAALPDNSVHCAIASPPYWGLRAYNTTPQTWGGKVTCKHQWGAKQRRTKGGPHGAGVMLQGGRGVVAAQAAVKVIDCGNICAKCGAWRGEHGLEPTIEMWVENEVAIWREVRRVLRWDGTLWLNVGDAYATQPNGRSAADGKAKGGDDRTFRDKPVDTARGLASKQRLMLPARLALALQADGWYLRDEIVWHKLNPMPSSIKDRTTPAHEMLYLLTKSAHYYFDNEALKEPLADSSVKRLASAAVAEEPGGHRQTHYAEQGVGKRTNQSPARILKRMAAGWQTGAKKPAGWETEAGVGAHSTTRHAAGNRPARHRTSGNTQRLDGDDRGRPGHHMAGSVPWDGNAPFMDKRNKRSVWSIATEPFAGEFCLACRRYFEGEAKADLRKEIVKNADGTKSTRLWCRCGRFDRWQSHFATFPTALVEPCLAAGAPQFVCDACAAPFVRAVNRRVKKQADAPNASQRRADQHAAGTRFAGSERASIATQAAGWKPVCKCDAQKRGRAVILDPFFGSGTTAVAARELLSDGADHFDVVGVELNADYAEMAELRLAGAHGGQRTLLRDVERIALK